MGGATGWMRDKINILHSLYTLLTLLLHQRVETKAPSSRTFRSQGFHGGGWFITPIAAVSILDSHSFYARRTIFILSPQLSQDRLTRPCLLVGRMATGGL